MALANYSDLATALATWLARDGDTAISGNAADLIALANSRLNRILPLRVMTVDTTLVGSVGSRQLTLPNDFVEPIALFVTISGVLTMLQPKIAGTFTYRTVNGIPVAWCINGTTIDLDCLLDSAYTFSFRYRQAFTLSATNTTTWLMTNHPDCYLAAGMVQAALFTRDGEFAAMWQGILNQHIEEIAEKDARSLALAPLTVDPALTNRLSSPGSFNFTSGQ